MRPVEDLPDGVVLGQWLFVKGSDVGIDGTEPVDEKKEDDAAFKLAAGLSVAISTMSMIYWDIKKNTPINLKTLSI